MPSFFGFAIGR